MPRKTKVKTARTAKPEKRVKNSPSAKRKGTVAKKTGVLLKTAVRKLKKLVKAGSRSLKKSGKSPVKSSAIQKAADTLKRTAASKIAAKKPRVPAVKPAPAKPAVSAVQPEKPVQKTAPEKNRRKSAPQVKAPVKKSGGPASPAPFTDDFLPVKLSASSQPKYVFSREIPDHYNETFVCALPRDPEWLFIYWEISRQTMDTVAQSLGMERLNSSKRILRLIDVTESEAASATRTYDIEINAYANNWYLRVPEQARTYIIELGQLCSDGSFNLVVRSNSVCVPRAGISPLSDEEWATVNTDELIRLSRESVGRGFGSSEKGPAGQTGAGPGPGEFPGGLSSASYLGSGSVNL